MPFANANPAAYTWWHDTHDWVETKPACRPRDATVRYRAEVVTTCPAHFVEVRVERAPQGSGLDWLVQVGAYDRMGDKIPPPYPLPPPNGGATCTCTPPTYQQGTLGARENRRAPKRTGPETHLRLFAHQANGAPAHHGP
jgi:hypothetical protein